MKKSELRQLIKETIIELSEQYPLFSQFYIPVPVLQSTFGFGLGVLDNFSQQYPGQFLYDFEYGSNTALITNAAELQNQRCCSRVRATQEGLNIVLDTYPNIEYYTSAQECESSWNSTISGYTSTGIPYSNPGSCVRKGKIDPNAIAQFNFDGIKAVEPKGNDGPNPDDFGGGMGHPSGLGKVKRLNFKRKRPNFRRR